MINFPIFNRLDILEYGLYPGSRGQEPGLHVRFQPGITLVIGSNGLGKSTLVAIIYRLLTGPYDIPGLAGRADLGTMRLAATALSRADRGIFAPRVVDGAETATARLCFELGDHKVVVERRLRDLALTHLSVDDVIFQSATEGEYQSQVLSLVGVWSFGDWILLLRHLVFYFEDRRSLVWDPAAQRQILRFLFLSVTDAQKWTEDEREILELDSRMRNLGAALYREEKAFADNQFKTESGMSIRQELQALEGLQETDRATSEQLEEEVIEVENQREQARLRLLKAEQEHEASFRELEMAKLTAIGVRFPSRSETARYILAQLLTDNRCLVCDNMAPEAASAYAARLEHKQCVICGTDLSNTDNLIPAAAMADRRVKKVASRLNVVDEDLSTAKRSLDEAEQRFHHHFESIQELNSRITERSWRIDSLIKRLPPDEAELHQQRAELASIRSRVEQLRQDLTSKREIFRKFVESVMSRIVARSAAVKASFNTFAKGFLFESCELIWSPQKGRLGQTGEMFDFPAFELELSGTDFPSPVRRTGPEQVSESQREFIDLAFRMALMQVAGNVARGSLVIDAPESSLDAVFAERAAKVLSRFAKPRLGNRLMITSNLVQGRLIPDLIANSTTPRSRADRIVDLFEIATPTAAIRELRREYDKVRRALIAPRVTKRRR